MAKTPVLSADDFPVGGDWQKRRDWFLGKLEGQSHEACVLIAARTALQALPGLGFILPKDAGGETSRENARKVLLPLLRCNAISAVASIAPISERALFRAATTASALDTAFKADTSYGAAASAAFRACDAAAFRAGDVAYAASKTAALAADASIFATSTGGNLAKMASPTSAYFAVLAARDSASTRADEYASYAASSFVGEIGRLEHVGLEASVIAPLWPGGAMISYRDAWADFAQKLRALGDGWEIWAEWYGGVQGQFPGVLQGAQNGRYLFGLPTSRALKLWHDVALIEDALWKGEPAALNAEFRRLVDAARGEGAGAKADKEITAVPTAADIALDQEPLPQQLPAITRFGVIQGQVDVLREIEAPSDRQIAEDLYLELKEKALAFKERATRAQFDEVLRRNLDRLIERLGSSFDDVLARPGRLLSALRSLESDVQAFNTPEGRGEVSIDAISMLIDVKDSTRDLVASFPKLREIEAEGIAQDLVADPVELTLAETDSETLSNSVQNQPYVTVAAQTALKESGEPVKSARSLADRAKQVAYRVQDARNYIITLTRNVMQNAQALMSPLRPVAKKVGEGIVTIVTEIGKKIVAKVPEATSNAAALAAFFTTLYPALVAQLGDEQAIKMTSKLLKAEQKHLHDEINKLSKVVTSKPADKKPRKKAVQRPVA